MYKRLYLNGKFVGVLRELDSAQIQASLDNRDYREFLDWNAKQPVPLDLSDKPPEPPPVDSDLERVKEILAKRDDLITAGEVKEAVLRFLRRNVR